MTLRDKVISCEFRKAQSAGTHLLQIERYPPTLVLPCDENAPRKIRQVIPACCSHEVDQRPGALITSPTFLSGLHVEPAELSHIAENREVLRILPDKLSLRIFGKEKRE